MQAHGSGGVSALIVLSLPPDRLFMFVLRLRRLTFLHYISVVLRVDDSGLHRAACCKCSKKKTCQGSEVKGQSEATDCIKGLQNHSSQQTRTRSQLVPEVVARMILILLLLCHVFSC